MCSELARSFTYLLYLYWIISYLMITDSQFNHLSLYRPLSVSQRCSFSYVLSSSHFHLAQEPIILDGQFFMEVLGYYSYPLFFILSILFSGMWQHSVFQQYQATGRGFVVKHITFSENYRLYSRSHFVKGYLYYPLILMCIHFFMYTYLAIVKDGLFIWYAFLSSTGWKLFSYWLSTLRMEMIRLVLFPTFFWLLAAGFWLVLGFLLLSCSTLLDLSGKSK